LGFELGILMVGKLFKWMLIAWLLAAVLWHYRDTEAVRKRRTTVESVLAKVGVEETSVRRYWPLEGPSDSGSVPSETAASDTLASPAPSVWNDVVKRFNPITLLRDRLDAKKPATTP
jgi:hypothetical protein